VYKRQSALWAVSKRPFPQHVTYAAGVIRPTNFTQAQQDQHVRDFYNYWKSRYLVTAGSNAAGKPLYRVAFGQGSDVTVSEGQGYGMVTVALMEGHDPDAQKLFDGLWYFSRKYPSAINNRLMSWKVQNGNMVGGNNNAFDGDVDIAYGLLLAHEQWGSSGAVNYQAEARLVIDAILTSTIGSNSRLPKLGDWTSDNGSTYNQYTPRSSDFMPAHFRAFATATQNTVWNTVIQRTQAVVDSLQSNYSSTTGLLPDFIIDCQTVSSCRPAYGGFLESGNDGAYYYNAGRDPWRIGLDALLNGDTTSRNQALKMIRWLAGATTGQASNIKAGYQLDGTPIGHYTTSFFLAPFGVSAMLEANQQTFLNNIYALVYNKKENYYEDSVNLLSLLAMTGNYWQPGSSTAVTACADAQDNDSDGKTDYPNDPGCVSATDTDETDPLIAACTDNIDNDGDGKTDYPADPGCSSVTDDDESNPLPTACADAKDNDSDGKIDYPNDPGCSSTTDTDETDPVTNFTLTVSKTGKGAGTINSAPAGINCGADCSEAYASDTAVTLTPTAATGSTFTGWTGCTSINGTACLVTVNAAKAVKANFNLLPKYTLTATKTGTGTGTVNSSPAGINCGTDCSEAYTHGTVVTLTPTAATGSTFKG
jgi:endo-1,4-beta-D-glucanase Y